MKEIAYQHLLENEGNHWWHVGKYAAVVRFLRGHAHGETRILDLGASFGTLTKMCSAFSESFALDRSLHALRRGGHSPSVCGDATKLPFKAGSFDIVVAVDLLEHLREDGSCLEEALRILKTGGRIFVFVPAYPFLWSDLDELGRHYRRYTPESLRRLFASCRRNKIVRFTHFNFFLFVPILIIRILQRIVKRGCKEVATDSMKIPSDPLNLILKKIFLLEGRLVYYLNLPIGVSLIVVAEKEG